MILINVILMILMNVKINVMPYLRWLKELWSQNNEKILK